MKKLFPLLFKVHILLLVFVSCKDDKKNDFDTKQSNQEIIKEVKPEKGIKITDLKTFLATSPKPNQVNVNKSIGNKLMIENISFFKDSINHLVIKIMILMQIIIVYR